MTARCTYITVMKATHAPCMCARMCTHLHHLLGKVSVVHVEDGCLDVTGGRKAADLNENVVGPPLV